MRVQETFAPAPPSTKLLAISCAKFLMSSVRVRHKQKFSFHWKLSKTNFNFSALQIYGFLHLLHSPLAISRVLGMALSCSWPVSILLTFKYQFANKLYWSLLRMVFVGIDWTWGPPLFIVRSMCYGIMAFFDWLREQMRSFMYGPQKKKE